MSGFVLANEKDLELAQGDLRKKIYKYFQVKHMELLEATCPSGQNCPIDMGKVDYEIVAT